MPWTPDDELSPQQLAAMDQLWQDQRDGIDDAAAEEAEAAIRSGHVMKAYKLLAQARRALPAS